MSSHSYSTQTLFGNCTFQVQTTPKYTQSITVSADWHPSFLRSYALEVPKTSHVLFGVVTIFRLFLSIWFPNIFGRRIMRFLARRKVLIYLCSYPMVATPWTKIMHRMPPTKSWNIYIGIFRHWAFHLHINRVALKCRISTIVRIWVFYRMKRISAISWIQFSRSYTESMFR